MFAEHRDIGPLAVVKHEFSRSYFSWGRTYVTISWVIWKVSVDDVELFMLCRNFGRCRSLSFLTVTLKCFRSPSYDGFVHNAISLKERSHCFWFSILVEVVKYSEELTKADPVVKPEIKIALIVIRILGFEGFDIYYLIEILKIKMVYFIGKKKSA